MNRWMLLSLFLVAATLLGQVVEATGCVHKEGDDPAWARPDFDDRDWQTALPRQTAGYTWTRCRLDLRSLPATAQRQFNVGAMGAWELFVDGARIAVNGDLHSGFARNNPYYLDPLRVDTPNAYAGEVRVALRQRLIGMHTSAAGVRLQVGTPEFLAESNAAGLLRVTIELLPTVIFGILTLFAGLVLLILFRADQSRKELLWFGVLCLSFGVNRLFTAPFATLPLWLFADIDAGFRASRAGSTRHVCVDRLLMRCEWNRASELFAQTLTVIESRPRRFVGPHLPRSTTPG